MIVTVRIMIAAGTFRPAPVSRIGGPGTGGGGTLEVEDDARSGPGRSMRNPSVCASSWANPCRRVSMA